MAKKADKVSKESSQVKILGIPVEVREDLPKDVVGLESGGVLVGGIRSVASEGGPRCQKRFVDPRLIDLVQCELADGHVGDCGYFRDDLDVSVAAVFSNPPQATDTDAPVALLDVARGVIPERPALTLVEEIEAHLAVMARGDAVSPAESRRLLTAAVGQLRG